MVAAKKEKLKLRKCLQTVILLQKWIKRCLDRFRLKRKLAELTSLRRKQTELEKKKELSIHKNNIIDKMECYKDPITYNKSVIKHPNTKQTISKNKG